MISSGRQPRDGENDQSFAPEGPTSRVGRAGFVRCLTNEDQPQEGQGTQKSALEVLCLLVLFVANLVSFNAASTALSRSRWMDWVGTLICTDRR